MKFNNETLYGEINGPIVLIGFGSIGKGIIPLLLKHFKFDKSRMIVIDPSDADIQILKNLDIGFLKSSITIENYQDLLKKYLKMGNGTGFCINLSVDVSSLDIMKFCREIGSHYIDTVVEPWPGFYFNSNSNNSSRTNYALRETILNEKRQNPGGITAVSCCGANPGMVSWFVKEALIQLAQDLNISFEFPKSRIEWAKLMQLTGVKGIHIAERDTQNSRFPKPPNTFVNTWSVEGFIAEGMQPAELGWGSHEKWMPKNAYYHTDGCQAAIYLNAPGANTKVRTWCPTHGAQYGRLVTHNESISIADYFTVGSGLNPEYRPTCHYAYHPSNDAILSLEEIFGANGQRQPEHFILNENEIIDGMDELGVLLYGHNKNAYWFGSQLTIEETKKLAPYQNATGLQVTSAVIAGIAWTLENPNSGIVEADEMNFQRCLEFQRPYLGEVKGYYTDWNPIQNRPGMFPEDIDPSDPWQFKNVLV